MGNQPPGTSRTIQVPSGEREVAIGTVSAGDTWSFSAAGEWGARFVRCGPDGYRNFLYDALDFRPRVRDAARLKLMGKFADEPDWAAFPIGAGCTKTFARSGELVVFANDRPDGYAGNRGAMTLTVAPGGVAAGPTDAVGGLSGWWRDVLDIFNRTAGVSVIAAFALGVSGILLLMPQGRDLVRGVGEDGLGRVATAFALGILFFAIQAWSWSRIVIASNYGTDRTRWRPRALLEWGPRVLAFLPFAAAGFALLISFKWNAPVGLLLLAIGAIFLLLVIFRQPITRRLVGHTETAPWIPGAWVIAGLAMAFGAMVVAILWPAGIGVALGGAGDRVLRARLHHSPDHDRLPARHEPPDPGHGRAPPVGGPARNVLRQSPGRAARPDRGNERAHGSSDAGERLPALAQGPTGRPERQARRWFSSPSRAARRARAIGPPWRWLSFRPLRRSGPERTASRSISAPMCSPSARCRAAASARSAIPPC